MYVQRDRERETRLIKKNIFFKKISELYDVYMRSHTRSELSSERASEREEIVSNINFSQRQQQRVMPCVCCAANVKEN